MKGKAAFLLLAAGLALVACDDGSSSQPIGMMGPSNGMTWQGASVPAAGSPFLSISPAGGAAGIPTSTPITLRFGGAMAEGAERYLDLHVGSLAGPVVAVACGWSPVRTTLTCTRGVSLDPNTTYVIHLGGGMPIQAGGWINYGTYGPMMGGQWVMGGYMGGTHAGHAWGTMGPGWAGSNGHYGMAFPFTTA